MTGKVYIGKRRNARTFLCFVKKTFVSYVKKKLDKTPPISQKMRDSSVRKEVGGPIPQSPLPKSTTTQFRATSAPSLRTA